MSVHNTSSYFAAWMGQVSAADNDSIYPSGDGAFMGRTSDVGVITPADWLIGDAIWLSKVILPPATSSHFSANMHGTLRLQTRNDTTAGTTWSEIATTPWAAESDGDRALIYTVPVPLRDVGRWIRVRVLINQADGTPAPEGRQQVGFECVAFCKRKDSRY